MIQDIDLRALSEYEGPERAFLSVYVGGEAGAASIDHRLDALRALVEDDGDPIELEHFDENRRLVADWLEAHPSSTGTRCVFACFALDLLRGFEIELRLPTDVRVGVAPYVRPLAELQEGYETFAVVAADNDATRVLLVTAKQSELAGQIRGGVKNHVKKGGWSQKRYQRRRDNELQHYARDVASFLADLAKEESFDRIVLAGSEETAVAIENELDPALRERVIAREAVDLKEGEDALVAAAFEHYWEAERAAELDLWRRIRGECKSGGLAALGPTDVLLAVQTGRAEAIAVERDAEIPAVRCGECDNTFHGTPRTCQICGAGSLLEVDLINELVRRAEQTGAEVDFVDPIPGLTRAGRVAALLRY